MAKQKKRTTVTKSKRGKKKTLAKKHARASASKMAKRAAKSRTRALAKKVTRGSTTRKARPRKKRQVSAPAPQVEMEILDIVEEPVPGIVTVTEIETVRVTMPDSGEETKTDYSPPDESGMAA